jgi:hypothetical protein
MKTSTSFLGVSSHSLVGFEQRALMDTVETWALKGFSKVKKIF